MRRSTLARTSSLPGRILSTLLLFLALPSVLSSGGERGGDVAAGTAAGRVADAVVTLDNDSFDDMLSDPANGLWLLKFYAPWCGHCKKLLPTLNKVAPFIKGKMAIGTIDCTREDALCKRFDVTGFPTLKFYRDGSFYDYPGKRDADSIIDFAEKMSKPAVRMVGSLEEALKDVAGTNPENVAFLMYDPQGKANDDVEKLMQTTTDLQVWNQVGRKIQAHASFAVLRPEVTADTVKKFGVGSAGPFLIKIERDVDPIVYEGEVNSPDVLDFVKKHNVALVTKLGPDNFRATGTLGKPLAIGVVDYEDKEGRTERLLSEITRFAKSGPPEIRDKFLYAHMDAKKWASFLKKFGVNTNDLPDFFVLDVPTRKFWKEEKEENAVFDPDTVQDFLAKVISGAIPEQDQMKSDLGLWKKFEILYIQYLPWSVFLMMVPFLGLLWVLATIFLPEYDEAVDGKEALSEKTETKKDQ